MVDIRGVGWAGSQLWEEESWMCKRFSVLSDDLCLERAVTYPLRSRLGVPNCHGLTGEVSPAGLVHMGTPVDYGAASISSSQLMWWHHKRAGNLLNQQLPTPVLNQDILSQEGLLSPIILNNQNLAMDREELQMLLLGGSLSFGIRNDLLEAAGTKALEGLICKGSLGGLCGHGSLSGMNDVLKNMNSGQLNNWWVWVL